MMEIEKHSAPSIIIIAVHVHVAFYLVLAIVLNFLAHTTVRT
jgi:hypothetical protein